MRVVIAEGQFLLREGLTRMLEAHGIEIGVAVDNGDDLVAAVTADPPTLRSSTFGSHPPSPTRASARRSRHVRRCPDCRSWCCRNTWSSSTRAN